MQIKLQMESEITTPILLIAFNRPDTTRIVFNKIRDAKPLKLYVAIDGHRKNVNDEDKLVEEVKEIVKEVAWECQTYYKFNETNLGAEMTVSTAVSWVLEKEETVIVLEDDIIAPKSFLNFAQEMLIRYAESNNIYMVSSIQVTPIVMPNDEDYLFGLYGHTWGWATWKRAWKKYDLYIDDFDKYLRGNTIDCLVHSRAEKKYWQKIIKEMKERGIGNSTWDYCWSYIRFKEQGLSIIPRINLSSNIGVVGLHARGQTEHHFKPYDENFVAKIHPQEIRCNIDYDKHHFKTYLNRKPLLMIRVLRKVLRILNLS